MWNLSPESKHCSFSINYLKFQVNATASICIISTIYILCTKYYISPPDNEKPRFDIFRDDIMLCIYIYSNPNIDLMWRYWFVNNLISTMKCNDINPMSCWLIVFSRWNLCTRITLVNILCDFNFQSAICNIFVIWLIHADIYVLKTWSIIHRFV